MIRESPLHRVFFLARSVANYDSRVRLKRVVTGPYPFITSN
jgi:hypothetical protein